jgi:membrane-associated phospholipid phosphatase
MRIRGFFSRRMSTPEKGRAAGRTPDSGRATLRTGARVVRRRWPALLALLLGILIPLAAFGALAEDVWEKEGIPWDGPVLRAIHDHADPLMDPWVVALTRIAYQFGTVPAAVGLVLWMAYRRRHRDAVFVALAVGGAGVLMTLLKLLFRRGRPMLWESLAPETDFAFPSGHATLNTALAAAVVLLLWPTRWRWPALGLAVLWVALVDLSRLYLGVHFPSDVAAGTAGALSWVLGLRLIVPRRAQAPSAAAPPERGAGAFLHRP